MPAEITLPVHIRVGDHPETHVGDLVLPLTATVAEGGLRIGIEEYRTPMAAFLRAAADAIENPSEDDEEATDAAP